MAHGAIWVKEAGFGAGKVTFASAAAARSTALIAAFSLALAAPAGAFATGPSVAAATTASEASRADLGAAPRRNGETAPRPALWLLADHDTRIYLFGTLHMLPPGLAWRSGRFETMVREADELVLEVAEDNDDEQRETMASLIALDRPVPISDRVSPERRAALREMVESLDMKLGTFDRMQTWAAAMSIAVVGITRALAGPDGSPEELTGVEDELRIDFSRRGRPITGVEDGPQQLTFLSRLSERTQRQMLEEMIDSFALGDPDFADPGEDDWLSGDVSGIATEMETMPAELFDVLLTRRNTAWTAWLIERLDRPGTVLFAVGAGHLAGRNSVQSMLAARGFTVTRIQ